jgi:serine phosphatase RsbU (regulator of sigma subunit)
MMALAQRLNEDARQGILDDLARIESASKNHHVTHTGFGRGRGHVPVEAVVDEISVLALGFQNLVHRVGDQYQQLAQLVQELREALRVKTQYIAIQQELEIARKMQLAILPQAFEQINGFSIDARMLPAKEIGGDFYDFFPLDAHRVAIAVADVSGKGIPAAFFMAVSRTLLRAVAPFDPSPAVCLYRLNNLLAADNPEMMFVTLFYAVLDTRTGHVQYGSAGHNPPYLVRHRSNVPIEIPSLGNMALAVMEDMPYDQADFVLEPGDRLFLYTDGVTEAMSPEQELYGEERLMLLLTQLQQTPAALVPDLVLDVLHAFEGDGAQADDITTLVVHHTQANPT